MRPLSFFINDMVHSLFWYHPQICSPYMYIYDIIYFTIQLTEHFFEFIQYALYYNLAIYQLIYQISYYFVVKWHADDVGVRLLFVTMYVDIEMKGNNWCYIYLWNLIHYYTSNMCAYSMCAYNAAFYMILIYNYCSKIENIRNKFIILQRKSS